MLFKVENWSILESQTKFLGEAELALVTIGVPVFNGGDRLRGCLDCLRGQTFQDFEVLIYDNASTDDTGAIANEFVRMDGRFHYYRQSENVGAYNNFIGVLNAAKSQHFLWRAHDDICEPNYLEVLHKLLTQAPGALLAAPIIVVEDSEGRELSRSHVPVIDAGSRLGRVRQMLRQANSAWFYGMWDREFLTANIAATHAAYPFQWASDPLMLFPVILNEAIVCTGDTTFYQYTRPRPTRVRPPVSDMIAARRAYIARCEDVAAQGQYSPLERFELGRMIRANASDRCYGLRKIARRYLREVTQGRQSNSIEDVTQTFR